MGTQVSGWTTDTLRLALHAEIERNNAALNARIDDLVVMLDERYNTQSKALDAAFAAEQKARQAALDSAEKAVEKALAAQKEAVTKAETATEKRFESVNEFRGQLGDMISTLMPRQESVSLHQANQVKLEDTIKRSEERFEVINNALTTFISQDKYDTMIQSEQDKRELALTRVNERFEDYVKRYEARQREIDQLIAAQKAQAEQVAALAKASVDQATFAGEQRAKHQTRLLTIASISLAFLIAVANYISGH